MKTPVDRACLTDGREWFTAAEAALYLGYRVQFADRSDRGVRSFYEMARRTRLHRYTVRGSRHVQFHRRDLDRLRTPVTSSNRLEAIEQRALRHAAGE